MTIVKAWIDSTHWMFLIGVYRIGDEVTFALGFISIVVRWT